MDGSALSHGKASRPSAFCSLHKQADTREAQVSVSEGRHAPLPGDSYRMLTLAVRGRRQSKARPQVLLKRGPPDGSTVGSFTRKHSFRKTIDLERHKKQAMCQSWGTIPQSFTNEENLSVVTLYWVKTALVKPHPNWPGNEHKYKAFAWPHSIRSLLFFWCVFGALLIAVLLSSDSITPIHIINMFSTISLPAHNKGDPHFIWGVGNGGL